MKLEVEKIMKKNFTKYSIITNLLLLSMSTGAAYATNLVNTTTDYINNTGTWDSRPTVIGKGETKEVGYTGITTSDEGTKMDGEVKYYIDGTNSERYFTLKVHSSINGQGTNDASCEVVPEKTNLTNYDWMHYTLNVTDQVSENSLFCDVSITSSTSTGEYAFKEFNDLGLTTATKIKYQAIDIYDERNVLIDTHYLLTVLTNNKKVLVYKWDDEAEEFNLEQEITLSNNPRLVQFYSYSPTDHNRRDFLLISDKNSSSETRIISYEYRNNQGNYSFQSLESATLNVGNINESDLEIVRFDDHDFLAISDSGTKSKGYVKLPKFYMFDSTNGRFKDEAKVSIDENRNIPKSTRDLVYFSAENKNYLAAISNHNSVSYNTESYLYEIKLDGTSDIELITHSKMDTYGANGATHFTRINSNQELMNYLAISNTYHSNENDQYGKSISSPVYYYSSVGENLIVVDELDNHLSEAQPGETVQWLDYSIKYDNGLVDYLMLQVNQTSSVNGYVYSWLNDSSVGTLEKEAIDYHNTIKLVSSEFIDINNRYFIANLYSNKNVIIDSIETATK